MSSTLQKGWLTTRDGQNFAPATLVENVYTRSGKPYDERVREYIQGLKNLSSTDIATLKSDIGSLEGKIETQNEKIETLKNKTNNFDDNLDDKLFIIDSADNVIAYIDGTGINSIDFNIPNSISLSEVKKSIDGVKADVATIEADVNNRLKNFNGNDDDTTLFIIDKNNNVVAYIDEFGIHTTQISVTEGMSSENNDSFYFMDKNDNVIAYIDGSGFHCIDFLIDDQNGTIYLLKNAIESLLTSDATLQADIQSEVKTRKEEISRVEELIADEADNRVQAINDLNQTITDKVNEEAELRKTADATLQANIQSEANIRSEAIGSLDRRTSAVENKTQNLDSNEDTDGFYVIDSADNVIAYINDLGIHTTDVFVYDYNENGNKQVASLRDLGPAKTNITTLTNEVNNIKKDYKKKQDIVDSGDIETNKFISKVQQDADGKITITKNSVDFKDYYTKENIDTVLSPIQDKLETVSNVMDFIGVFETLSSLYEYSNPNNGDVAVVTDLATEYVYDSNKATWVEFGNSTATSTAISHLQGVVGTTEALPSGKKSHKERITDLETELEDYKTEQDNRDTAQETSHDALASALNYRGEFTSATEPTGNLGDIAVIDNVLSIYNGTAWEAFEGLSKKLYYLDGTEGGVYYFIDKEDNVIAYIDSDGLTVTNINIKTPVVPDGETANEKGQSASTMIFFKLTGTATVNDSILL